MSSEVTSPCVRPNGVMAIPVDTDDRSAMTSDHQMTVFSRMEAIQEDQGEPVINVRMKGQGKEIKMYDDASPSEEVRIAFSSSVNETSAQQKIIEQQADNPDIRSTRKRRLSPKLQQVCEKGERPLQLSTTPEFSSQEGIKPIVNTKKKRPDSPLKNYEDKKQKLKKMHQNESAISEAASLQLLKKWVREGVTINGQKFEIQLKRVEEVPPTDKSYLEQHGFSPGNQQLDMSDETSLVKPMPTISEEQTLSTFVDNRYSPEGPMDLSCKASPMDLSCKAKDYSVQVCDKFEEIPASVSSDGDDNVNEDKVTSEKNNESSEIDVAEMERENGETSANAGYDNLPSLTQNLNLDSRTLSGPLDKPKEKPSLNIDPKCVPALYQLLALTKTPAAPRAGTSAARPQQRNTLPNDQRDQDSPTIPAVPDFSNLGLTLYDGTLRDTPNDKLKDQLRNKIKKK